MLIPILFAGCSQEQESAANKSEMQDRVGEQAQQLEAFMLDAKPEGAITVIEARSSAIPGTPIVITGQIGAADEPFGTHFATFVIGDEAIDFCDELHGDTCATPWDACCEDPDKLTASRASVQLTLDGAPVSGSCKGVGGLKELDHVVVAGVVAPTSTPENLIIHAFGVYRMDN